MRRDNKEEQQGRDPAERRDDRLITCPLTVEFLAPQPAKFFQPRLDSRAHAARDPGAGCTDDHRPWRQNGR